jgi:hypothetical protein
MVGNFLVEAFSYYFEIISKSLKKPTESERKAKQLASEGGGGVRYRELCIFVSNFLD